MIQAARVYLERSGQGALIVTMHRNQDGIGYEDDNPTVLGDQPSPQQLGQTALDALRASSAKVKSLRDAKATDWPAFKASKARSIRQFEDAYLCIDICGLNSSNALVAIEGSPGKDTDLRVTAHANPLLAPELGQAVLRVFTACRDRKL